MNKMGRPRKFNEQERELIYRQYVVGLSQIQLSIQYDCSEVTIGRICRERGGSFHQKTLAMMMHDWNAGATLETIKQKYHYKSKKYLKARICSLRKKGMKFERRGKPPTNAFKKKSATELEKEMRARQIPIREVEQTFADGVRESRAEK